MGSIRPYETGAGRRYSVRYRDPDNRQREQRGFTRKKDAELWLAKTEISKASGAFIDEHASRVTIGDLGPAWLAGKSVLKPSSYAPLEIAWRVYVHPRWGAVAVSKVRHSDVQNWLVELGKGTRSVSTPLSASSVIRIHSVLAGILDTAVKDRRIAINPARDVTLPRKVKKRRVYLDHRQVEQLASVSGQHAILVRFLAYTGLRWGEATALRVRDLDLLRRRLTVQENAVRVNGRIIVGTPKSHEARSVPIAPFLVLELARQCEGRGRDDLVFGSGSTHLQQPTAKGGWYVSAIAKCQAAGEFPKLTVHDLRHTAASLAISSGANVKAVQRMLGHASAAMTLDTYADLFDEDLDAVSTRLDEARRSAGVGT